MTQYLKNSTFSSCVHIAFTFLSLFVQHSLIVQSDNIIFRRIIIHRSILFGIPFFFLITYSTQCKNNSRGQALRINRSSCIQLAFTYHSQFTLRPCLHTAFGHCYPFISPHQITFIVCTHCYKLESRIFQGLFKINPSSNNNMYRVSSA